MASILPNCLCPLDSPLQKLAKISDNLALLFNTMASGDWTGNQVTLVGNGCGCTEAQILAAINGNLVSFFAWYVENGGGGGGGAEGGLEALAQADASIAIVFPTAFAAPPAFVANIMPPNSGAAGVVPRIDKSTLTTTGVTVRFTAIPSAGYFLSWIATEET